ncbi:hypothetical protein AXF42_Ash015884 [Apostasia shenzhenica]|uniref:Uncharacterized protein n=1 Tax=Apostasia shenzhenica TaxID=1088818 RepID=A0A2H9ZXU1_9ASPA|nr:hypothetical protein AXF42_Ash015884 [Apostasia shenzhenica]
MVEMAENKTDLVLLEEAAEKQDLGSGKGEEDKEDEQGLKPWEQHSAVISLPRFDYKAPSALLERSYSGFLITCPIKREKSATKEAISILEEVVGLCAILLDLATISAKRFLVLRITRISITVDFVFLNSV